MRVIIIDDNPQFLESLEIYLRMRLGYSSIKCFELAQPFLDSDELYEADIVLMDIEMPEIDGIEAAKIALWKNSNLKIIAVTNYQEDAYLTSLISSGFKGCVFKNDIYENLNTAIETVKASKLFFPIAD